MNPSITRRAMVGGLAAAALSLVACGQEEAEQQPSLPDEAVEAAPQDVDSILDAMSSEQLVAQLVIPSIRQWDGTDVTDLAAVPELAETLRRRQLGGVVLFENNLHEAGQVAKLTDALQSNNAEGADAAQATAIPYFVFANHEGGIAAALPMGTRGTGNLAIAATGSEAVQNALLTGQVLGEELTALGINANLAPCVDHFASPADPGMSTRSFGDKPETVALLADAFADGMGKNGIVSAFGHFPGYGSGDTSLSTDVGLERLRTTGLATFAPLIEDGAEMILASATTFSTFDNEHMLGDGETRGYYPATMSSHIVANLLREELGFGGVVLSAPLDMERFREEATTHVQLFAGEPGTVDYAVDMAQACLRAGCDALLVPVDVANADQAAFLDAYVATLAARVDEGALSHEQVRAAAERILRLKEAHGMVGAEAKEQDAHAAGTDVSTTVVGSQQHHVIEQDVAEQAVTQLKNEGIVPLPGSDVGIAILCGTAAEADCVERTLARLLERHTLDPDSRIENLASKSVSGSANASTKVSVMRYLSDDGSALDYPKETSTAVSKADYVVCLSSMGSGVEELQETNPRTQAVQRARAEAKEADVPFVLISTNMPVDAARFADADAILCTYLSAGCEVAPAKEATQTSGALNANIPAALRCLFGAVAPKGSLPIDVPELQQGDDGRWAYTKKVLYARDSQG